MSSLTYPPCYVVLAMSVLSCQTCYVILIISVMPCTLSHVIVAISLLPCHCCHVIVALSWLPCHCCHVRVGQDLPPGLCVPGHLHQHCLHQQARHQYRKEVPRPRQPDESKYTKPHFYLLEQPLSINPTRNDYNCLMFVSLQCCTTSGCNWSWDTAANNQALSAADTSDDTTLFAFVGAIVFGLLVLLSCLLFCFIYFWRSKKEEDAKVSTFYCSNK